MVFSDPVLRDSISRQPEFDNLNDYLDRVNSVLLRQSDRHYHCSSSALARLRNTLITLVVCQLINDKLMSYN